MTETWISYIWDTETPLPGEKLFDPSRYGSEEYFVLTLAAFIMFVIAKHLIFHTGYFWWYRQGQFYIPDMMWSLVSGKTLPQRVVSYVDDNLKGKDNPSIDDILALIEEFCVKREFAPTLGSRKGKVLEDTVKRCSNPDTVLVFGCHVGYPLLTIIKSLSDTRAKIVVIEEDLNYSSAARSILKMVGKDHMVTFVSNSSEEDDILKTIKTSYGHEKFDFVFLNRTKLNQPSHAGFVKSLEAAEMIHSSSSAGSGKQSYILADKVITPGDAEFLKYVRLSENYETEYFQMPLEYCDDEIYDGMELAISKV